MNIIYFNKDIQAFQFEKQEWLIEVQLEKELRQMKYEDIKELVKTYTDLIINNPKNEGSKI